jgi:hypothetical protein
MKSPHDLLPMHREPRSFTAQWLRPLAWGTLLAGMLFGPAASKAAVTIMQPVQAASGPGGQDYPYANVRITQGGSGVNAYYVFEPISPQPVSAPLVVVTHGYFEFAGYGTLKDLILHTVRKGNVVVYPRWQTFIWAPCAGSFNSEKCMASALKGIQDGIASLKADPKRVQPELDKASYFGFSFGGIITANLTNRWASLNLPRPRAIFLDEPHDGGYQGPTEPALDKDLSGIPADVLIQCHVGEKGVISEKNKPLASCNTLFPRLGHIPESNKNLVMTYTDSHGTPTLNTTHGVSTSSPTDAYDHHFVWKSFDAMRSCALQGKDCDEGMGDTPEHRFNGVWSDGVPVKPLKIQTSAPIAP